MRTRRILWHWLVGLVVVAVAGMVATSVLAVRTLPRTLAVDIRELPEVSGHPIPPGALRGDQGTKVFLVRGEQGWRAFTNRSTHRGEPVEWRQELGRFLDIYSGAMWDKDGRPVAGPAPRGLDGFAVAVDGDYAVIDFGRPVMGVTRPR